MPSINFNLFTDHLVQSPQDNPIKFAFGRLEGEVYTNTMPFVRCRDYFSDSLTAYKTGKAVAQIYGFTGEPHQVTTILLLTDTIPELIACNLHYLNDIEDSFNIKRSELVPISGSTCAIHFDPVYLSNTVSLSWFTWMFRLLSYEELKSSEWQKEVLGLVHNKRNRVDYSQLVGCVGKLEKLDLSKILKDIPYVLDPEMVPYDITSIHTSGGIFTHLASGKEYIAKELL